MADDKVYDLVGKIGTLEKIMAEDRHNWQDGLKQFVSSLETVKKAVEAKDSEVDGKLAEKVSRDEIETLISQCLADPGGEACVLLRKQSEEAAGGASRAVLAENSKSPLEKHGISHKNAKDLLTCDGCSSLIYKEMRDDPEYLRALVCDCNDPECIQLRKKLGLFTLDEAKAEVGRLSEEERIEEEEKKKKSSWI